MKFEIRELDGMIHRRNISNDRTNQILSCFANENRAIFYESSSLLPPIVKDSISPSPSAKKVRVRIRMGSRARNRKTRRGL